jgi:putative acyl-CoA dehydrogenase
LVNKIYSLQSYRSNTFSYREGSGNVICLDILRAMKKSPESLQAYLSFMHETTGSNKYLDAALERVEKILSTKNLSNEVLERHARTIATQLALCLQAALLIRRLPPSVSDAFCSSRLGPNRGSIFGDLPMDVDTDALMKRLPF